MNQSDIKQKIYSDYKKYFELNDYLIQLADDLIEVHGKIEFVKEEPKNIINLFFCKAYKTYKAGQILCKEGYGMDAAILLRSLMELNMVVDYIFRKPEERIKLYIEYSYVATKHFTDNVQKDKTDFTKGIKKVSEERKKEIIQDYEKVIGNYPDKYNWAGKSIGKLAKDIGLETEYNIIYWHLSQFVHPTNQSSNEYLGEAPDGSLLIKQHINDNCIGLVLATMPGYFCLILEYFNKQFELGQEKKIKKAKERISKT